MCCHPKTRRWFIFGFIGLNAAGVDINIEVDLKNKCHGFNYLNMFFMLIKFYAQKTTKYVEK